MPMDGHFTYHQYSPYQTILAKKGIFGVEWPSAIDHPLFYIGVYSAIGFASALASVLSVTAQYTGALRASRILFKYVF